MLFELYLMDLLPEKRKEFLEAHGCWDAYVENPSTFPNNWDIAPIMVFDTDDVDDTDYLDDTPTPLSLEDTAVNLMEILVDNVIDDAEVMAEAIWDLFIPTPLPSLEEKV